MLGTMVARQLPRQWAFSHWPSAQADQADKPQCEVNADAFIHSLCNGAFTWAGCRKCPAIGHKIAELPTLYTVLRSQIRTGTLVQEDLFVVTLTKPKREFGRSLQAKS